MALLAAIVVSCTATESVLPTPSASSTAPASRAPESPTPTPLPSGRPVGGVEAYALGALHGEYAFVLNGGANTTAGAVAEVWAIPLAGGEPRLAARYVNASTPTTNTGANVLARQFSPDGRRLVLSVAAPRPAGGEYLRLVIVDLETGRTTTIGSDDTSDSEKPTWSPDGNLIAFVKRPIIGNAGGGSDVGIWAVNVDGNSSHKIPIPPQSLPTGFFLVNSHPYGWTADGRLAWFFEQFPKLTLTDVASGASTQIGTFVGDALGLSFRAAAPRIAGSFSNGQNCPGSYLLVTDGAAERILVPESGGGQCPVVLTGVRWSPTRDEILYIRQAAPKGELHIRDLSSSDQRIAAQAEPVLAEWSADGSHVAYINRTTQQQFVLLGDELRYVKRDGTDERTLFTPRGASLSDLAVRLYP